RHAAEGRREAVRAAGGVVVSRPHHGAIDPGLLAHASALDAASRSPNVTTEIASAMNVEARIFVGRAKSTTATHAADLAEVANVLPRDASGAIEPALLVAHAQAVIDLDRRLAELRVVEAAIEARAAELARVCASPARAVG
ncbi:MAG: hypothetical protein ACHREM_12650, partial [Polyangiales bacterium]